MRRAPLDLVLALACFVASTCGFSGCDGSDSRASSDFDAAGPITDAEAVPADAAEDARNAPLPDAAPADARPSPRDAAPLPDDADAPGADAAAPANLDAAGTELDAASPPEPDAGDPDPVGTPCAVDGAAGVCMHVAECEADPNQHATPGHCPGPADVQCCTDGPPPPPRVCDADVLVRPEFVPAEALVDLRCPAGMVYVDAFCVDRYEASLLELTPDGEVPWSPYHNPGDLAVRAVSVAGVVPQGYINGDQAGAACAASGKRLCSDAEWLRACQGPDALTYPYGAAREPGTCNDARAVHPAIELFPDDPTPFDRIQDACINQLPASLDPTGANPGCLTHEGAYDMMGNLHEWTSDPAGTFRGGFYVDTAINGNGCLYRTTAHDTRHWDYSTGFRCCADPLQ